MNKTRYKEFVKSLCLDDSEAEICGNGLRCFARYNLEKHHLKKALIETKLRTYKVSYLDNFYGQVGISILLTPIKKLNFDVLNYFNDFFSESYMAYDVSNLHIVTYSKKLISKEAISLICKKYQHILRRRIGLLWSDSSNEDFDVRFTGHASVIGESIRDYEFREFTVEKEP